MKRQIPLAIIFVGGVFMVFQYFVPHETSEFLYEFIALTWPPIIGCFALTLGIISLTRISVARVRKREEGWGYPLITLAGLAVMLLSGVPQLVFPLAVILLFFLVLRLILRGTQGRKGVAIAAAVACGLVALGLIVVAYRAGIRLMGALPWLGKQTSPVVQWQFRNMILPISATMMALLAFFVASAAYRAFRARSALATLLLVSAVIVMLRFFPLGPLTGPAGDTANWILYVPNLAAKRAIIIGVGLGIVSTALKVVLGIERSYLGRD